MVDQIKLIKSYQQNKINLTDVHLLERIKSFIFILLFLNFSIWFSFHSSHHLIANQNLDPKFEEFDQVHVHHRRAMRYYPSRRDSDLLRRY